jgi:hypothetical protein
MTEREPVRCAGWRGTCPNNAVAPRWALWEAAVRRRGGEPYRCSHCAHARLGELRRGAKHWTARITHCPQGHPYDEANTRMYEGRRYCRACARERARARKAAA